jgi:hypothetical protein
MTLSDHPNWPHCHAPPQAQFCGPFNKHFTGVTYSPSKVSCTTHQKNFPCSVLQIALAYFAMTVACGCKLFMKLTPVANFIKHSFCIIYATISILP